MNQDGAHDQMRHDLEPTVGSRIKIFGGYAHPPQWLGNNEAVFGTVKNWIPGQNKSLACVVSLDRPLTAEGEVRGSRQIMTGSYVVLETRYVGQGWEQSGTVHVELCEREPSPAPWPDREVGAWIESHATYELLV
jgi:hypothetical protein